MIKRAWGKGLKAWHSFFFEPTLPATLGLFRICFGAIIFLAVLGRYPCRHLFYGEGAIVSYETMGHYFPGPPLLYFRWLPETEPWLNLYFLAVMGVVLCFT